MFNQVNQSVKNLWRKRYQFASTKQQSLWDVQAEVPEGIDVRFLWIHGAFQKLSNTFRDILKTFIATRPQYRARHAG